ncbi:MAG: molybdopterin molybdotransferase MoeA [Acidimicrobiia bacterium]|nr:molybdopterin molybdotransferase MoeA [Acidimicrobiia bacterium]
MMPLEEAQARVNRDLAMLETTDVAVADALGMVLAETVVADEAIPPFANTAMDGFAVRAADTIGATKASPVSLPVVGTIAAGSVADRPLEAGEAMRIMTGAPVPPGSDAIIMVELTRPNGFDVDLLAEVPVGNHVRPAGDDIQKGTEILHPGTVIGPGHLGVLASLGRMTITVYRRPRVGVMSTGDELVEGDQPLKPGQIRDSNRVMLLALVAEAGLTPVDLGMVPDNEDAIEAGLRSGAATCDAVLTSGGVSMGDFDYVKAVLTRLGDFSWMQVAIKPAKPLVFGLLDGVPVFGLPGNPVSSMVSFELFARAGLRRMMGRLDAERPRVKAIADEPLLRHRDGKTHFTRVNVQRNDEGVWRARSSGGQGSHQLMAMATANGLAVVPNGSGIEAGDAVEVILLG